MILVNYEIENEHNNNCLHHNLHEIDNDPILKIKKEIKIFYSDFFLLIYPFCFFDVISIVLLHMHYKMEMVAIWSHMDKDDFLDYNTVE
jgi:hypothetical protein